MPFPKVMAPARQPCAPSSVSGSLDSRNESWKDKSILEYGVLVKWVAAYVYLMCPLMNAYFLRAHLERAT